VEFKDPLILLLIPIMIVVLFFIHRSQKSSAINFPSLSLIEGLKPSWKSRFSFLPRVMRYIVLTLFLVALAGPRIVSNESIVKTEGIDIVLAIDASGSMAAEDFKVKGRRTNRLNIVKGVVKEFVEKRENDRLGLIAFAGLAFTASPLTTDYQWLITNLERVELGLIEDGTAIGSAIVSSVSRLKESEAKSKVIVLLTDGVNTAGSIDPIMAAQTAKTFGIKIYTIGAGSKGKVPFPMTDFFGRRIYQNIEIDIDEEMLQEIAGVTQGKYFRATDTQSLREVYKEIDKLEKTEIQEQGYREFDELFDEFVIVALLLLIGELFLRQFIFLKIP
jgi:Ca-activated chloride channel family protein